MKPKSHQKSGGEGFFPLTLEWMTFEVPMGVVIMVPQPPPVKVIRRQQQPFGLLLLKVVDVSFNYCYFGPTSCLELA